MDLNTILPGVDTINCLSKVDVSSVLILKGEKARLQECVLRSYFL